MFSQTQIEEIAIIIIFLNRKGTQQLIIND